MDYERNSIVHAPLSRFDTSRLPKRFALGEREARAPTDLIDQTTFGFNHGVGRSGNISAPQPKAVGASIMQSLINTSMLSFIKNLGINNLKSACVLPLSTGMSLALSLRSLDPAPFDPKKNKVLMTRIDHTSPMKGIELMRYEKKIVETKFGKNFFAQEGVFCDPADIEAQIDENCFAIVSTTSFFAPRVPDPVKDIAKIAKKHDLIHIMNNAYGLQSDRVIGLIKSAIDAGRVDAIVSSTDKNFLCPIGGSVVYGPSQSMAETISKHYAGRASSAPYIRNAVDFVAVDGVNGYKKLRDEQSVKSKIVARGTGNPCRSARRRVIRDENPVSAAFTLNTLKSENVKALGGHLYNLRVLDRGLWTREFKRSRVARNAKRTVYHDECGDRIIRSPHQKRWEKLRTVD